MELTREQFKDTLTNLCNDDRAYDFNAIVDHDAALRQRCLELEKELAEYNEMLGDIWAACSALGVDEQYDQCGSLIYYDNVERIKLLAAQRDERIKALEGALKEALYCIEVQNMHSYNENANTVDEAIEKGYWCKLAIDARKSAQAALAHQA